MNDFPVTTGAMLAESALTTCIDGLAKVSRLMAGGLMNGADLRVLWNLMAELDPNTCKADITATVLAERYGHDPTAVRRSLSKLKKLKLVAIWSDERSGHRYFLVNPELVTIGGAQRRGYLIQLFRDAIDGQDITIDAPLPAEQALRRPVGEMDGLQP